MKELQQQTSNLPIALTLLCLLFLTGILGYHQIEGWPPLEAFYMTLITVTTIGFGEVHPLSPIGRIFTSSLIIAGISIMAYIAKEASKLFIEGQIRIILEKKKMEKIIKTLSHHFIVCGFGQIGTQAAKEITSRGHKVVVIEINEEAAEFARKCGHYVIEGDATLDEVLLDAGVKRAKALIATTGSDASNVFITLTAKGFQPNIHVVVRAEAPSSEKKLLRSGADRVISIDIIGGRKMALAAMRPNMVEFMDIITFQENTGYRIEEMLLKSTSPLAKQTIREANIRQNTGVVILGVKKADGRFIFNPSADLLLEGGDILLAVGNPSQLATLEKQIS